jgi:hypothetical protein
VVSSPTIPYALPPNGNGFVIAADWIPSGTEIAVGPAAKKGGRARRRH